MKAAIPKAVQVVQLDSGKFDLRCLQCVRSITVADTQSTHAHGFYQRHTHARAAA